MDTEMITAQEFNWIVNNEPSFQVEGNSFIGKVGRTASGQDITLKIELPAEFYPIVKPEVYILSNINHPNIDPDGQLALQLLEEWEPTYRVKDIIITARRLFLKSKNLVEEDKHVQTSQNKINPEIAQLQDEISDLQQQIQDYSRKANKLKAEKINNKQIKNALGNSAVPISQKKELEATQKALIDLLGLIEYKFEDASMDEIVFFRLYRKYIREHYIVSKKLEAEGGKSNVIPKQKTKEAIRN